MKERNFVHRMSKYKSKVGTPEVNSARSKLDGLLNTLVNKKDEKGGSGDGVLSDDGAAANEEPGRDSVPNTPTKRSGTGGKGSARKRRRGAKDDGLSETAHYHHTYVMKLFDRSVDLAQFDDSTPLYPICRAWMRNQPHNRNLGVRSRSLTPPPTSDDNEGDDIYDLPDAVEISLPKMKREPGSQPQDLRIPEPLICTDPPLNISAPPIMAPEQLLLNHMARWKIIRTRWRDSGRLYEERFAPSMRLLKDMYERQCKE